MFPSSSPAELSCRDPTNSAGIPHSQCPGASWSSATSKNQVVSKAAENPDTHCTNLVLLREKKKKAAKRAGVRSAGRASCSRVALVPSPSSHVLQLYRPFQASSSPHSPNHAVSSIYCRKLAGGGFFPPLALGAAPIPLPRGCVGSWPNKHCPAPLLPRTSSFQACFPRSVWGAAAPLMHLQAEGAGGGSWKALSRKMP